MSNPLPLPPNLIDGVEDAAMLTNDLIDRAARNVGNLAKRWMDGLTSGDVDTVTKNIGIDVNQFWVRVYATAEDNVTPGPH